MCHGNKTNIYSKKVLSCFGPKQDTIRKIKHSQSGALDMLQNPKIIYLLVKLSGSFNEDGDKTVIIVAIDGILTKIKIQENSGKCRWLF